MTHTRHTGLLENTVQCKSKKKCKIIYEIGRKMLHNDWMNSHQEDCNLITCVFYLKVSTHLWNEKLPLVGRKDSLGSNPMSSNAPYLSCSILKLFWEWEMEMPVKRTWQRVEKCQAVGMVHRRVVCFGRQLMRFLLANQFLMSQMFVGFLTELSVMSFAWLKNIFP